MKIVQFIKGAVKKMLEPFPRFKQLAWRIYRSITKQKVNVASRREEDVTYTNHLNNVIYFDITSYCVTDAKTGIQRVVYNFLKYLPDVVQEQYDIEFISGLDGYHIIDKETYQPNLEVCICPKAGDLYLSIDLNPVQPYVCWPTLKEWQKNGCKLVACVYDLVYVKYPEYVADQEAVRLLSRWLKHVASHFDGLICISEAVENELRSWIEEMKIKNERLKIGFFHLGADFIVSKKKWCDSTSSYFRKAKIGNELSFLAVSTIEPRKGYSEMVDAFEQVLDDGESVNLLIVGRFGWKCDEIVKKITNSQYYNKYIFWFSDCDDGCLDVLYQMADCYISNSYYEGFGLGIIEASNKDLPLLLKDIPVNREVSNNQAIYFDSSEDLKCKIEKICKDQTLLSNQKKIKGLSWEESVQMAWQVIQGFLY